MFEDLHLFAMAQRLMDYSARRQSVISENVANSNTPAYKAKDLAPLSFKDLMAPQPQAIRAVATNPMHISPEVEPVKFETVTDKNPAESKPDGNTVSPEEQMQKIGDVNGDYNLAVNLFMKNINMLKIAIGKGS
jgi:flagellar basal-body rod protein FlgB